jgi:hypothetical protein
VQSGHCSRLRYDLTRYLRKSGGGDSGCSRKHWGLIKRRSVLESNREIHVLLRHHNRKNININVNRTSSDRPNSRFTVVPTKIPDHDIVPSIIERRERLRSCDY